MSFMFHLTIGCAVLTIVYLLITEYRHIEKLRKAIDEVPDGYALSDQELLERLVMEKRSHV